MIISPDTLPGLRAQFARQREEAIEAEAGLAEAAARVKAAGVAASKALAALRQAQDDERAALHAAGKRAWAEAFLQNNPPSWMVRAFEHLDGVRTQLIARRDKLSLRETWLENNGPNQQLAEVRTALAVVDGELARNKDERLRLVVKSRTQALPLPPEADE